ncbi:MAG TPA: erythromycin esterase family protein [Firmicutes bacterium]|nr:erythromycin esterase family protein [Candidatus Fermentithermobacillaceae bacterium]
MSVDQEKRDCASRREIVRKYLEVAAIPLRTVQASSGFQDLEPLKKVLDRVRVVGLGESTHGTREFFQLKHRLLEFLVKEMGYTVFSIEASYPACCNDINNYVLYGKGDRSTALASQGFWTWDTEEVSSMVDWMREYNRTCDRGREVKFLGYDPQRVERGMEIVEAYLTKTAPQEVHMAKDAFESVNGLFKGRFWEQREESDDFRCQGMDRLYRLIGFIAKNKVPFVRASSREEYEWALQNARVICQYFDCYSERPIRMSSRDVYMAENIEYIAKYLEPDAKLVVWAHNAHILNGTVKDGPSMGAHLRRVFGEEYYALGMAFDEGSFQSRDSSANRSGGPLTEFTVGPTPEGFLEWYLSGAPYSNYIVDFRSEPVVGPVRDWLSTPLPMRNIGSGFKANSTPLDYSQEVVLADNFDGMAFVKKATRAVPNPTGRR